MIDPESMERLRNELRQRMAEDREILERLRAEVRSGLGDARRIMSRQTTAVSLVGTDGGNNRIEFDPFMAQVIRVVDSSNNEYCLEVVTPTSDLAALSRRNCSANHICFLSAPPGRCATWQDRTSDARRSNDGCDCVRSRG